MVGLVKKIPFRFKKARIISRIGKVGENFVWKGSCIEFPKNVEIGDNVYIGPEARLYAAGGIIFEDGVICGPRLTIYTYNHNYFNSKYLPYDEEYIIKQVIIKRNVWLGDSVSIVPGVTIGEGCVIGMRSVITKDVPPFSIVGGNPAVVIKQRSDKENYAKIDSKSFNYLKNKKEKNLKPIYRRG